MNDFNVDTWAVSLCQTELVEAVLAVRGEHGLMQILVELFELRPSARLCVFTPSDLETVYSLSLDAIDRHENKLVGKIDAVEVVKHTSHRRLESEIRSWTLSDLQRVTSTRGGQTLVRLGLITQDNVQQCSQACRDAFFAQDLGL